MIIAIMFNVNGYAFRGHNSVFLFLTLFSKGIYNYSKESAPTGENSFFQSTPLFEQFSIGHRSKQKVTKLFLIDKIWQKKYNSVPINVNLLQYVEYFENSGLSESQTLISQSTFLYQRI